MTAKNKKLSLALKDIRASLLSLKGEKLNVALTKIEAARAALDTIVLGEQGADALGDDELDLAYKAVDQLHEIAQAGIRARDDAERALADARHAARKNLIPLRDEFVRLLE